MPEQFFFIEGRGYTPCQRGPRTVTQQRPVSFAFFCPVCAEVWARAGIPDERFFAFHVPCRKHTYDGVKVPGSLYACGDVDFLKALPADVLLREFLLHLDYAERKFL